jgi:ribosomal protein L7/L12
MQFTNDMDAVRVFILESKSGAYKYRKLELCKLVRDMTGLSQREANQLVESVQASK